MIDKKLTKQRYYQINKEEIKRKKGEYYQLNKEKKKEEARLYYSLNKDRIKKSKDAEYQEKKDPIRERSRKYRELNKDLINEKKRNNWKENRNNIKEYTYKTNSNYTNKRKQIDLVFKIEREIRNLINSSIRNRGFTKKSRAYEILGCTYEEFKIHIEKQFKGNMIWQNHGEWEYDHIIPVSSAINEEDVIRLNHYTNFQPLWKLDNRRKGNKINYYPNE